MVSVTDVKDEGSNMKIQCFSFNSDNAEPFIRVQEKLLRALGQFGARQFNNCDRLSVLMSGIGRALEDCDVIIAAAEPQLYNKFKQSIIKALSLDAVSDGEIMRVASATLGSDDPNDTVLKAQALIPDGAQVFMSRDGLHCGLGMEAGGQHILLLPLDAGRLEHILNNGAVPYLQKSLNINEFTTEETKILNKEQEILRYLAENSVSVAVSATPASDYIKDLAKGIAEFTRVFSFTPNLEDRGDTLPKDYAASIARVARELSGSYFGVALTNIYEETSDSGNEDIYVLAAVADEDKVSVRKIFANDGEGIPELLKAAADELFSMIYSAAKAKIEPQPDSDGQAQAVCDGVPAQIGKKGPVAVLIILLAAIVLCVVMAVRFGDSPEADDPTTTQASTTLLTTTEAPTFNFENLLPLPELPGGSTTSVPDSSTTVTAAPTRAPTRAPATQAPTQPPTQAPAPAPTPTPEEIPSDEPVDVPTQEPEPEPEPEPESQSENQPQGE